MALVFLKSLLLPRAKHTSYTLLPNHTTESRDPSFDSTTPSATPSDMDEKPRNDAATSYPSSSLIKYRIDPRLISDATIGLSDGLTVPFALTAGLSALGDTRVVIYGGLAELIAGGISMGLGGYLGARSEAQAYEAALAETRKTISEDTARATELVRSTFDRFHFSDLTLDAVSKELALSPDYLEDFLMRFHHGLSESASTSARAYVSALTIAAGYFFGGLMPLLPYFVASTNRIAFLWSVAVMAFALFTFGYVKTMLVGEGQKWTCMASGFQMMVLGGVAATAAMGCVKAVAGDSG